MELHTIVTLQDFLRWAEEYFTANDIYYGHGTDNPWDEAVMLALYVLQLSANPGKEVLDLELSSKQKQELLILARRRVEERIPVPYLTKEAWFAGERYYIDSNVIIPRSPIAELILDKFSPFLLHDPKRILDMCTGSGCLAILCSKIFSTAKIDAVDISAEALAVASKNLQLHKCSDQINLIQSDIFTKVSKDKYDLIISNPPYVDEFDMNNLPAEYKHEPELALASGKDGLDLTCKILEQAADYLTDDGLLIIEVGNSSEAFEDRFPKLPVTWIEFANGGDGVFLIQAKDLKKE